MSVAAAGSDEPRGDAPADDGSLSDENGGRATGGRGPAGDPVGWLRRGEDLLAGGDAAAAASLLRHAVVAEPAAPSVREAYARALFGAGDAEGAEREFRWLVDRDPSDAYARYGLGLALRRLREASAAVEQLALATALRPDREDYARALRAARAVAAQEEDR